MRPLLAGLLCLAAGCGGAAAIRLTPAGEFTAAGEGTLTVSVEGADVPLFGETRRREGGLVFTPRFPPVPGKTYVAVFTPAKGVPVRRSFAIPKPSPTEPTAVSGVFPTGDRLPENLLKFYIHFTGPMSRGDVYDHIRLVEATGRVVDRPFLQLSEELWDRGMKRLTIFIDPGRIKRGLRPREEVGPALEAGKSYTLVIDRGLVDARGRRLKERFEKRFTVAGPDEVQPDTKRWKVTAPGKGTRDPLSVAFDEPLDAAMLRRVLVVRNGHGDVLEGEVEVDNAEQRWRFRPARPWEPGPHGLDVDAALEDRSGNSIGRPFEVDLFRRVRSEVRTRTVRVPFEVR